MQAAISSIYGLTGIEHCRLLKTSLNDTYIAAGRDGRYVARIYHPSWRSLGEIRYELDLLTYLAAADVPVAAPVARPDGDLTLALDAPEGTRYLALFDYVPGVPASWDRDEHCNRLGHLAARIHAAASDFQTQHRRFRLDLEQFIDIPLARLVPLLSHRAEDLAYLRDFCARVHARATALLTEGLDWGPCHGDFHVHNVHVDLEDRITALDFDWSAPGWRAYDLTSVYGVSRWPEQRFRWDSFLRGYSEVRGLRPQDLAAVPILRVLRHLMMSGVFAAHTDLWGARTVDDKVDRWLVSLRKWEAEHRCELPAAGVRRATLGAGFRTWRTRVRDPQGVATALRYSLLAPEAIAREVAGAYALEGPAIAHLLRRGVHDTYELTTGADRYIARVHRHGDRAASQVGYELDLLAHLARKGVPVALPVAAPDGSAVTSLAAPEGTRCLVLFAWAPGKPLTWDRAEDAWALGKMIARVHAASDDFRSERPRSPLDLDALVEDNLRALQSMLSPDSEEWNTLRRFARRLRSAAESAIGTGLDWGACHGNLGPALVHRRSGRTTITGFDRAAPGWRVYDVAATRREWSSPAGAAFWAEFVSGYRDTRPLEAAAEVAIPVFCALRRFSTIGTLAANAEDWGTAQLDKSIGQKLSFFKGWKPVAPMNAVNG